jgi:hypothetical protein
LGFRDVHNFWAGESAFTLDDGQAWYRLPHSLRTQILGVQLATDRISEAEWREVGQMFGADISEPISRVLWREANSFLGRNERAALVIGFTALEVGCKELIGELVPNAKWLAMEAPTPPLDKILSRYVPTLPKKIDFVAKAIPKPLLKSVKDAVEARNAIAHRGEFTWDTDRTSGTLSHFNDLLWMFNVYAGRRWATEHISSETRQLLGRST